MRALEIFPPAALGVEAGQPFHRPIGIEHHRELGLCDQRPPDRGVNRDLVLLACITGVGCVCGACYNYPWLLMGIASYIVVTFLCYSGYLL